MRIENTAPLLVEGRVAAKGGERAKKQTEESVPIIQLSPASIMQHTQSSSINMEKIHDIKSKITNGEFQINADAIAAKLLSERDILKFLMG